MMRNNIKVSVIIPVYNMEKYLTQAVDSVLTQTMKDLELILVDDGSTDGSLSLCYSYAEKDNRITVLKSSHKGVSEARNAGIMIAKGEYLSFVDGDDWISNNMYEVFMDYAEQYHPDIIGCGSEFIYYDYSTEKQKGKVLTITHKPLYFSNASECGNNFFKTSWVEKAQGSCWNKVFRREMIIERKLLFPSMIRGEDTAFNYMVYQQMQSFLLISEVLYHYRENTEKSLAIKIKDYYIDKKYIDDIVSVYEEMKKLLHRYHFDEEQIHNYLARYFHSLLCSMTMLANNRYLFQTKQERKAYIDSLMKNQWICGRINDFKNNWGRLSRIMMFQTQKSEKVYRSLWAGRCKSKCSEILSRYPKLFEIVKKIVIQ